MRDPGLLPIVTLHGTASTSLVADICDITHHLRKVAEALAVANPHGRDYRDVEHWKAARDAWHDRRVAINAMLSELEMYAYGIVDQNTVVVDLDQEGRLRHEPD